jgi:hypothetical protein
MVKSQRFYLVIAAGEFEKRMEGELGEAAAAIGGGDAPAGRCVSTL